MKDSKLVLYKSDEIELSVPIDGETVWFTQKQICELFDVKQQSVSRTLTRALGERILGPSSVQQFVVHSTDRKAYSTKHYSLEAAMYVGLRSNSPRAATLQRWALGVLREYAVEGYVLNERRLQISKSSQKEAADRIRKLRLADAFQELEGLLQNAGRDAGTDFLPERLMAFLQNDVYKAITGGTAADILVERCDHRLPNCGMIHTGRATTAKNYLLESELQQIHFMEEVLLEAITQRIKRGKWDELSSIKITALMKDILKAVYGSSPLHAIRASRQEANMYVSEQVSTYYQSKLKEVQNEESRS